MSDSTGSGVSRPEVWRLTDAELLAAAQQNQKAMCQQQAAGYELVAELQARGLPTANGHGRPEAFLSEALHISRAEANKLLRRAAALHPTQGITGVVPATAPATARAAAEGVLGGEHIDVVLDLLDRIPDHVPVAERELCEKTVADYLRIGTPASGRKLVDQVIARVDPDGTLPTEKDLAQPDRELFTSWTSGGQLRLKGRLDRETGQALEAALSPLSQPRPAEDGTPDPRTAGERNGDALAEMIDLVLREDGLPTEAGTRPTVTVVLDYNKLLEGLRTVGTINGTDPITAEQARRLACDADIIPAVLGSHSEVLDLGRTERLVNRAQRRSLNLRDGGCIFSGCTRPARWTQAHHIRWWIYGGPTDIGNLCLLCAEHHRLIHHSEWEIRMAADGHPECIPPAYIDPERKPRRNYAQHLP